MSEISEELVNSTWEAVDALSPEKASREMAKAGREQPELLAFVLGSVYDCGPEAQSLAIYLYFVILQVFRNATPGRLRPIQAASIEQRIAQNEKRLERLETAHPRFLERAALLEGEQQPFVVRHLVEALEEAPEGEDPVALTEEERGTLFLVLKTVIDLLHGEREITEGV